jgi:hypothetical protein
MVQSRSVQILRSALVVDRADITLSTMDLSEEVETFEELSNHPDINQAIKRRQETLKEIKDIISKGLVQS